jgi:hypothetical protein
MDVARVRIERSLLQRDRIGNTRIAMTHRRNIVIEIDVAAAIAIEQSPSPRTSSIGSE